MKDETDKQHSSIEYVVRGRHALFTEPESKLGGEKYSYHIPTPSAIIGITESIYWKPTITWIPDRVRIMKKVQTCSKGTKVRDINSDIKTDLSFYTYLYDVEYQVQAHYQWNMSRPDLEQDRVFEKHNAILNRSLKIGGRLDIFIGTKECSGYVEECTFGDGKGYYDGTEELSYGLMFHSYKYDEGRKKPSRSSFFRPVMIKGVIEFPLQEKCLMKEIII